MLNIARDLSQSQGLNKDYRYEARVVNNDDRDTPYPHTCRIQARIPVLYDGIPDEHLPWAIAYFDHLDGATEKSGTAWVPKVGSKVFLKFQDGRETHPVWSGYTVDTTTVMEEIKLNYPDRIIRHRLANGAITLYDTQTNELFIRNPGDLKVYIDGNVELTVTGDSTEVIKGNRKVSVEGNYELNVGGTVTYRIGGTQTVSVGGTASMKIGGSWMHSTGGSAQIDVSGRQVNNAGFMADQEGGPAPQAPDSVPESPDLTNWPGFPGGAQGE